jgi:16S rRNA (cytosine1402-N4)-methyltransferase
VGETVEIVPPTTAHVAVLSAEVRAMASVRPGERWVDATLGFGGHTRALLADGAAVLGLDQDPQALASNAGLVAETAGRLAVQHTNFTDLEAAVAAWGGAPVDGVLADLGVSSWQLDTAERGFSFQQDGPLDRRRDPTRGQTALELLQSVPVEALARLLRELAEEPFAGPIARAVKAWVAGEGPHGTRGLARAIVGALPRGYAARLHHHPATRTFQALRLAVNGELEALDTLLEAAPKVLGPGGRLLVISFHSLEDRRVKEAFARLSGRRRPAAPRRGLPPPPSPEPEFELLVTKPVTAAATEVEANPRSRSAKLRGLRRSAAEVRTP